MAVNIRFNIISQSSFILSLLLLLGFVSLFSAAQAADSIIEPVQACVITRDTPLTTAIRAHIAQCLGWQVAPGYSVCQGAYAKLTVSPLPTDNGVRVAADKASLYHQGRSVLSGHVDIQQTERVVNAQTAYIYRDAKSRQITTIKLVGNVHYLEPDRLIIAHQVIINPQDKSGYAKEVLYRFNSKRLGALLPVWGQARAVERFANKNYLLEKATYSTCAPNDNAWHLEAKTISLDNARAMGVARHAKLYIGNQPLFYTPYLSFPTSKARKSGFLIPTVGSSNVGGFDLSLPYYWNIAPNYDATWTPHLYTLRGLMMGGQFRYLTPHSTGQISARYLPNDKAYRHFILDNEQQYPQLHNASTNRWSMQVNDITQINPDLRLRVNVQQVSDDYYLQDFSNNLALLTERQLLREGELSYTTNHWLFRGMLQSYQTLQPVNQTPVSDIYQRLPQLLAMGTYDHLPLNSQLTIHGQFDHFNWPNSLTPMPEGPRYYINPILSWPYVKPWGYVTPSVEMVQNAYDINHYTGLVDAHLQRTIPRYSIDSGLLFERQTSLFTNAFTQTLEPRLYYLKVPFHDQTPIPVYDSSYMIFNTDQLFRSNRFSGLDRIGDTNQLAWALTSRWFSDNNGREKASFSFGQIYYFSNREVKLCQSQSGYCYDNPFVLGYLSPTDRQSPLASRALYHLSPSWVGTADYVWDPNTRSTNNGHLDLHYQPGFNQLIGLGYTYMVAGDITQVAHTSPDVDPLHQATVSYAWPFNDKWSSLGALSYNMSKNYEMMSLMGVQYDNCCWALRLIGGRSFKNLNAAANPQYTNNIYLQIQLKGLGAVGNSDPAGAIRAFLPSYVDSFHR